MTSYHGDPKDGVGFVSFWGYSPSYDMLTASDEKLSTSKVTDVTSAEQLSKDNEIRRFLLIGASDCRHIIHTLAKFALRLANKTQQGCPSQLHFVVSECEPELLCRTMLLLDILTDVALPVRERVEMFLEILGNSFVRDRTAFCISERVEKLIDMLHDSDLFDTSELLQRDKDDMARVFESWKLSVKEKEGWDVASLRDQRMRQAYGIRYDHRNNLFDWDFTMNTTPIDSIIHWREFKLFRQSGVAFEPRQAKYDTPNRTLCSYLKGRDKSTAASQILVRGFWGDIVTGPFACFGVDTDDANNRERLFRTFSEQHRHYSGEIAEFNVTQFLMELSSSQKYGLGKEEEAETVYPFKSPLENAIGFDHKKSVADSETTSEKVVEIKEGVESNEGAMMKDVLSRVKITFVLNNDHHAPSHDYLLSHSGDKKAVGGNTANPFGFLTQKHSFAYLLNANKSQQSQSDSQKETGNFKQKSNVVKNDDDAFLDSLLSDEDSLDGTDKNQNLAQSQKYGEGFDHVFFGYTASAELLRASGLMPKRHTTTTSAFGSTSLKSPNEEEAVNTEIDLTMPNTVRECFEPLSTEQKINNVVEWNFLQLFKPNASPKCALRIESMKHQAPYNIGAKIKFRARIAQAATRVGLKCVKSKQPLELRIPFTNEDEAKRLDELNKAERAAPSYIDLTL